MFGYVHVFFNPSFHKKMDTTTVKVKLTAAHNYMSLENWPTENGLIAQNKLCTAKTHVYIKHIITATRLPLHATLMQRTQFTQLIRTSRMKLQLNCHSNVSFLTK